MQLAGRTLFRYQLSFATIVLLSVTGASAADVITFDNLSIDHLVNAGPQVEGAFQYQATIGLGWEVQNLFGNPASALATFFNGEGSNVGDTVEITKVGGGTFTFNSVDYATFGTTNSDQVTITGYLNGVAEGSLAITSSTPSPNDFVTAASGFGGLIDDLKVVVSFTGNSNAMDLDNFTFNSAVVPEPSSVFILGLGAVSLLGYHALRRRRGCQL